MTITMIVAMSKNRVIGQDNKLPWSLPSDLQYFKNTTSYGAVIMGRKTFESIGRPLPNRCNIVISKHPVPPALADKVIWVNSIEQAVAAARASGRLDTFVIGGAEIYVQFLPIAHKAIIVEVDATVVGDAYFPEMPSDWVRTSTLPSEATGEMYSYVRHFWSRSEMETMG